MYYKQNLHVHCTYCDGKDTMEEMVEEALRQGFNSIGFSSHSYIPGSKSSMQPPRIPEYKANISRLKEEYRGRIDLFCGLEVDACSQVEKEGFDYFIGSVHYLQKDGRRFGFDVGTYDRLRSILDEYVDGDGMEFARLYYEKVADLPSCGDFDIIGHLDIVNKLCQKGVVFDEESPRYRAYALDAIHALAGKIPFFEVNTGGVARGYRDSVYPAPFLLKELKALGFQPVISSDCHDKRNLSFYYDHARGLLLAHGFTHQMILTDRGFEPSAL